VTASTVGAGSASTSATTAGAGGTTGSKPPAATTSGSSTPQTGATGASPTTPSTSAPASGTSQQPATPAKVANPNRLNQLADLQVAKITLGGHPFRAWVMDNESKQEEGMMFLQDKDVASDQGMIFVFKDDQTPPNKSFWMHNTYLPLDIIYIDKDKKVVNVGDGQKTLNDDMVRANGAYRYVLEVKYGTAAKLGIKTGSVLVMPSDVKAKE
jgi:uncharacterized membrane protein (UPF0127 family)